GDASYANGTFTIKAAGPQIYGSADAMHFAYQPLSGDGVIVARLVSVQGGTSSATAGVMIRESLDPGARNAKTADWPAFHRIYCALSSSPGGSTTEPGSLSVAALPYWVKLVRSGSSFTSYAALDGVNWVQLGSTQTIAMAANVYVGLAVNSGSTSLATATFDNVSITSTAVTAPSITAVSATTGAIGSPLTITGTNFRPTQNGSLVLLNGAPLTINTWSNTTIAATIPDGATSGALAVTVAPSMNVSNPVSFTVTTQPLPTGWLDRDVGALAVLGNATYSNATFTLNAAGQQIYGTVDAMHFVYQPLVGDGTIVARVVNLQGGSSSATAGVMIRETLDANARNAKTADWPAFRAIYFDLRSSPGGTTSSLGSVSVPALPYWVKLGRSGNSFTGFASANGVTWPQLGSPQIIPMAANVFIGLAANSGSATLATATFDNVSITTPTAPNFALSASPDSLSIVAGTNGATTITVTPQNGFSDS